MKTPPNVKPLPHKQHFYTKLGKSVLVGSCFILFSLLVGVIGYHYFFHISWVDSILNASMILTGMGPVDKAETDAAKLFSSFYAIYSGVAFLTSVAIIFSPVVHRFLHKFKIEVED